jgi:SAM-dependent methyltransferase
MLARARAKVKQPNVRFELADAKRPFPVADGAVDVVAFNLTIEHIEHLSPLFGEVARCLRTGGLLSISELHPCRQYFGGAACFERDGKTETIAAFVHHISDFLNAARANHLRLQALDEWWHAEDAGKPPRLISFLFTKE